MKKAIGILVGVIGAVAALSGVATGAGSSTAALTFVTGTNSSNPTVWVADANGQNARKLGRGDFPIISPNGKMVAVSLFGRNGGGVVIYNVGGGTLGKFVKNGTPVAWSPDSRYLAVSVFDAVNKGVGKSGLSVVDTQTKTTVPIATGQISGASFDPAGSGRLVYGLAKSEAFKAPVNLYTADETGAQPRVQLTHDGRSLNPLWTKRGFLFDRQTLRKLAPEWQIYELRNGHATQITNIKVDQLSEGLAPIAASADGTKLAAEYGGQDNSEGWAVNVVTHKAKKLATTNNGLIDAGITRDGKTLLVDLGIFGGDPTNKGMIATVPFGGGTPTKLIAGNEPSWNQ
jgi:hypothetical protein